MFFHTRFSTVIPSNPLTWTAPASPQASITATASLSLPPRFFGHRAKPLPSVADPDPHVFVSSGSLSTRYGSGSFYHQAKIIRKTLIPNVCDFLRPLYLWKMTKMYLQKVISKKNIEKKYFSVDVTDENSRIRIRAKSSWIRNTSVNVASKSYKKQKSLDASPRTLPISILFSPSRS